MADKSEYQKMLHAYALGSLERDDLLEMTRYLKSGGEFDMQELGEYENLASLIAISLEEKIPHAKVKDAVARKLYRMRDEIKAKHAEKLKAAQKKEAAPPSSPKKNKIFSPLPIDEEELINKDTVKFRFEKEQKKKEEKKKEEEKSNERKLEESLNDIIGEPAEGSEIDELPEEKADTIITENNNAIIDEDVFIDTTAAADEKEEPEGIEEKPPEKTKEFETVAPLSKELENIKEKDDLQSHIIKHELKPEFGAKSNRKNMAIIFLLILLTLLFAAASVYFYFKYQNEIEINNQKTGRLNDEITMLNSRIVNRDEARLLLERSDAEIVILNPEQSQDYSSKLYLSFNSNKGFIYLGNMPDLPPNQSYQLWIQIKGSHYSLGVFSPDSMYDYYSFKIPSIEDKRGALFLLSRERQQGSKLPGNNILLRGTSKK